MITKIVSSLHVAGSSKRSGQGPIAKSHQPLADQIDKYAQFKKWLALLFIERGDYKITEKGYEELAPQVLRQYMEFAEQVSDRKREERIERTYTLPPAEVKRRVKEKVEQMLGEGKAEELYDNGYVIHKADWKDKGVRIAVIRKLVEVLEKMREITQDSFKNNGLGGLLVSHYKHSPYLALVEAGYAYSLEEIKQQNGQFRTAKTYPWEMNNVRIYHNKEIRIAATKWLVWKLKKGLRDITQNDFYDNELGGLLVHHYNGSPYLALVETDYAYSKDEIKEHARTGFRTDRIYPWELSKAPHIYENLEIRIAATKWLVWKIGKETREITFDDFNNNGLDGLLDKYNDSPYDSLLEAGLVTPVDETYMRSHAHNH